MHNDDRQIHISFINRFNIWIRSMNKSPTSENRALLSYVQIPCLCIPYCYKNIYISYLTSQIFFFDASFDAWVEAIRFLADFGFNLFNLFCHLETTSPRNRTYWLLTYYFIYFWGLCIFLWSLQLLNNTL